MVTPQAAHISGALYAVKKKVTFDTNAKPTDPVVEATIAAGCYVTYASVSLREAGDTDFEVELKKYDRVPELAVWDESDWDEARWADEPSSERLENILNVISNGSFPKTRTHLTEGQLRQLRDAMILEAHCAAEHDIFVTSDAKGFVNDSHREKLQTLLGTRIMTPPEFLAELAK